MFELRSVAKVFETFLIHETRNMSTQELQRPDKVSQSQIQSKNRNRHLL